MITVFSFSGIIFTSYRNRFENTWQLPYHHGFLHKCDFFSNNLIFNIIKVLIFAAVILFTQAYSPAGGD